MIRVKYFRPSPTNKIGRLLWLTIWGPLSLFIAFFPLPFLNLFQIISLKVLPFSINNFRSLNSTMAWVIWGGWDWALRNFVGIKYRYEGDSLPKNETALVLSNHQGMCDIICLLGLANRNGMRDTKFMSKNVVKYVPFFGWSLRFIDFIMLKRNWADDAENIRSTFQRYCQRPDPFWVCLFPEGTRIRPDKLAASQRYAAEKNIQPTTHVLQPRPKGFIASIEGLRSKLNAVYSVTLFYGAKAPTIAQIARGDVDEIVVHVKRYDIASIPEQSAELTEWLLEEFRQKDAWLGARFAKHSREQHESHGQ